MSPNDSEISDYIVDYDAQTLARRDVEQRVVIEHFQKQNNTRAAAVVADLPAYNGILDRNAIDQLLVSVHCEMQSLAEEFHHGRRLSELLRPLLSVLREKKIAPPIRVVDVGCGTGYAIRWLALHGQLGAEVELLGADYNAALVNESNRLAREEKARCKFIHADVFRLQETAHVFISTGVVHHFRGDALMRFFAEHENSAAQAFLHYDFRPSPLAPMGSWFFHIVRMRTALARHDGTLSAVRAHSAETLLEAARGAAPGFISGIYGSRIWKTPLPRVFHTVVGIRPELHGPFLQALGRRRSRMDELR
jgi:2-polyprenyl-3-methyl-5-hydroxy-6-metoxy-1,4-benzoquinol methylase